MAGAPIRQVLSYTNETFKNGVKTVAVAGTAEPLTNTIVGCNELGMQAAPGNTGNIWIGGANVMNDGSTGGLLLVAPTGQPATLSISTEDLSKLYINSTVNGEGVTFLYW